MNSGKANYAAIRLILGSVAVLAGFFFAAWMGSRLGGFIIAHPSPFIALWAAFLVAVLYLSRDPDPAGPSDLNAIVSPAYGKVDVIEETGESEFMEGACRRVSIRVSLTDVQVQYAPVSGTVAQFLHRPARNENGASARENLFVGFDVVGRAATHIAVRLIGGTWGKRILPWIKANDVVSRGERLGMMRPAARVDLYLPAAVKLHVNIGDAVAGGQSVVAKFE
ncbi:MAG TPA: phosphatidylserine decarboxylase [Methylomirabilota bacterium]|nr:phosphatidylserine decarboxylase [Methylomirabilota bacterium]